MADLIELKIEGMHCDGCVRRVSALLRQLPGVRLEDVKVGSARLELSSPPTTRADLLAALQAAGFPSS
ncbi:MAG: heavy-metal-associated domain-containing protein [Acidobacteriota bacterium]